MGLDMYLYAEKYVSGWRLGTDEERNEYERLVELFGMKEFGTDDSPSANVQFTVGYWRKANHIHEWFVRECQDGVDECQATDVGIEKLKELRELCLRVLAGSHLMPGEVHTGTIYNAEHPQGAVQMEPGKIIKDPTIANELLPTADGFFFGSTDYDEWYIQDVKETVEIIDRCVKLYEQPDAYWSFVYRSSW